MFAVAFTGGFFASPKDFTKATPPRGVTYQEHYNCDVKLALGCISRGCGRVPYIAGPFATNRPRPRKLLRFLRVGEETLEDLQEGWENDAAYYEKNVCSIQAC